MYNTPVHIFHIQEIMKACQAYQFITYTQTIQTHSDIVYIIIYANSLTIYHTNP